MDIKSVVPSHLISERGSDVVVINFGSANLRVGIATHQSPVVVPHCIAHHLRVKKESVDGEEVRTKGTVGEQISAPPAARRPERDEICQMVELQLKMKPLNPDLQGLPKVDEAQRWRTLEVDDDKSFQWTQVMWEEESDDDVDGSPTKKLSPVANVVKDESESFSEEKGEAGNGQDLEEENSVKSEEESHDVLEQTIPDEKDDSLNNEFGKETPVDVPPEAGVSEKGRPDSEIHVEVRLTAEEPLHDSATCENGNRGEKKPRYQRYFCGEEALRISAGEPYVLRWPICRGRFNICPHYSLQQVLDDMYFLWDWVLTEKLSLGPHIRQQYSVVLVIPDTLDNREIKELLTIVLKDLKFRAAVVHQECVTATFGNGISSACVVNMGAQITSIVCIEDGVALPSTRIVLPFGGEDISRCLLWVQRRWQTWPCIDTDPLHDSMDLQMLERIKEERCLIVEGEQQAVVDVYLREAGQPTRVYKAYLKALCVPVMGLFYPTLLAPEEYPSLRPWFYVDHEDVLDDSFHVETIKRPEAFEVVPVLGNNGGGLSMAAKADLPMEDVDSNTGPRPDEPSHGLAQAIVISILSTGRQDIQKKLFASIQLVGGVALTRGLVDAVEERVLHGIPAHEAVDTVAVLQNRTDAPLTCWKGGAVLGILDFQREAWVQADEWITGGVRIGSGRKYRDSVTLQSQAFWYGTNPE